MPSPQDFQLDNGTVIDHLPAGASARALAILGLPREGAVTVGMNVPSARHGRKDIIRVEGLELRTSETDRLALIGPQTVSIVKAGRSRANSASGAERLAGVALREPASRTTAHVDGLRPRPRRSGAPCAYRERAAEGQAPSSTDGLRVRARHYGCARRQPRRSSTVTRSTSDSTSTRGSPAVSGARCCVRGGRGTARREPRARLTSAA